MDYIVKRLAETFVLISCSVFAYWIRFDTLLVPDYYLIPITIYVISASYLLVVENGTSVNYGALGEVRALRILVAITFAGIITATCLYLTKTGESFSRAWLLYSVLSSSIAIIAIRLLAKTLVSFNGAILNVIVIAEEKEALQLLEAEEQLSTLQIKILATFGPKKHSENPTLKDLSDARFFVESQRVKAGGIAAVKEVWVSSDILAKIGEAEIVQFFADSSVELKYVLSSPRVLNSREKLISLNDHLVIDSVPNNNITLDIGLKLLLDKTLSLIAVILLSPALLLISILIKCDSAGPIIYRQLRYGVNGIEFPVYKFRTMAHTQEKLEFYQAKKNDSRITRIGRFLRRTSLDELPQLLNVLAGNMSLVGPRPHPRALNEEYRNLIPLYMQRHNVKPGITGLAQIRGFRGETNNLQDMGNRVQSDLEYIRNWSLSMDIKILFLTAKHIITTQKAY